MEIRVLGPLEVIDHAGGTLALGGPKQRAVLALLALDTGKTVSVDRLVEGVWGEDPPDNAQRTLQVYVSNLRKVLGADTIATQSPGYRLGVDPETVDLFRFRRLVERARGAAPGTTAQLLDEALRLWHGPPLGDLRDLPFAQAPRVGLEEERLAAQEERIKAGLELGQHQRLVGELERLVADHPLRERFRTQLMLALYRSGRQADALGVYEDTRSTLADELGIDPSEELRDLHQRILQQDATLLVPEPDPLQRAQHNLPVALTSFIGRTEELAEIVDVLADHRLVTLTGVGGVGKTRLALEVAWRTCDHHRDGAWRVELAPVTDPAATVKTVAATFSLVERPDDPVEDLLAAYLHDRDLLLVLDNCEHLLDASAQLVADLLARCPTLRVLATSREGLGVPGEVLRPVRSLPLPPVGGGSGTFADNESVALFVERAADVNPGFELTPSNAPVVADVCRRLDGIPLAIELAAARVRMLAPEEIADRLEDRFKLLTGGSRTALPRHQTLEAAIDWSYDLLSEQEQAVLRHLSVFRGGFTLQAAEAVVPADLGGTLSVFDALGHLVEQSLVTVERSEGRSRYDLLETIRQYASARLRAEGEAEPARQRHLDHFVRLAEEAQPRFQSHEETELFDAFESEYGNVRAAVEFALGQGAPAPALRLLVALRRFLSLRGHGQEGRHWAERALGIADGSVEQALRAAGLNVLGVLSFGSSPQDAHRYFTEAIQVAEQAGDDDVLSEAMFVLANVERLLGNYDVSTELTERVLEITTDDWISAGALNHLGILARYRGELDLAIELHERVLGFAKEIGSPWAISFQRISIAISLFLNGEFVRAQEILEEQLADSQVQDHDRTLEALNHLGDTVLALGDPEVARRRYLESMALNRELGGIELRTLAISTAGLVVALHGIGRHGDAARAAGFTAEIRDTKGFALPPHTQRQLDETLEDIRAALGDGAFDDAFASGRRLQLEDVHDLGHRAG